VEIILPCNHFFIQLDKEKKEKRKKKRKKEGTLRLPKLEKPEKTVCGPCQLGKQIKPPHRKISSIHTFGLLELMHIDLMGPTRMLRMGGKMYIIVIRGG
jgi:hypothetical protein